MLASVYGALAAERHSLGGLGCSRHSGWAKLSTWGTDLTYYMMLTKYGAPYGSFRKLGDPNI